MMSDLPEAGRTGLTPVADSPQEARELYDRVQRVLEEETRRATDPARPLGTP
jgi:hypothetical protein